MECELTYFRTTVAQATGSDIIYIGHRGVAAEGDIIRIGTPGTQKETYIAGIGKAPKSPAIRWCCT